MNVTIRHASNTDDPSTPWPVGSCEHTTFRTHVHAEWNNWSLRIMRVARNGLWTITFDDVPVGANRIVVQDPYYCRFNPGGSVDSDTVKANGVTLSTIVSSSRGPTFLFNVDEDGQVTN